MKRSTKSTYNVNIKSINSIIMFIYLLNGIVPVLITAEMLVFYNISVFRLALYFLLYTAAFFYGKLMRYIIIKLKKITEGKIYRVCKTVTFMGSLVLLAIPQILFNKMRSSFVLCLLILIILLYSYYVSYLTSLNDMTKGFSLSIFFTFLLIGLFIYFYVSNFKLIVELSEFKNPVIFNILFTSIVGMYLLNNANIYMQSNRRGYNKNLSLFKIQSNNLRLIIIISIIFLPSVLIIHFFTWIETLINKITSSILMLFLLIKGESAEVSSINNSSIILQHNSRNENGSTIFYIVATIILLILILTFRKSILNIIKKILKFILKFKIIDTPKSELQSELGFIDTSYNIIKSKNYKNKFTLSIKELLKQYNQESNKNIKFRISYKILLLWFNEHSIHIESSDTVEKHQARGKNCIRNLDINDEYFEQYQEIRYADAEAMDLINSDKVIKKMIDFLNLQSTK